MAMLEMTSQINLWLETVLKSTTSQKVWKSLLGAQKQDPSFGQSHEEKHTRLWSRSHTEKLDLTWELQVGVEGNGPQIRGVGLDLELSNRVIEAKTWERFSPRDNERALIGNALLDWTVREACWKADPIAQTEYKVISAVRIKEWDPKTEQGIAAWTSNHHVFFKVIKSSDHVFAFAVALGI